MKENKIYIIHEDATDSNLRNLFLALGFENKEIAEKTLKNILEDKYNINLENNIHLVEIILPDEISPAMPLTSYDKDPSRLRKLILNNYGGYNHRLLKTTSAAEKYIKENKNYIRYKEWKNENTEIFIDDNHKVHEKTEYSN